MKNHTMTSVAFSLADNERVLAIAEALTREDLQKIGSSPACHAARQALAALRDPATRTAARWQNRIDAFRGGYDGLVQWYDERVREAGGDGQPAPVRPPRILQLPAGGRTCELRFVSPSFDPRVWLVAPGCGLCTGVNVHIAIPMVMGSAPLINLFLKVTLLVITGLRVDLSLTPAPL